MAPLTLWLTDRSRYEEGTSHCQRARYLRYHAGPHGYGWDKKAQSMPAVTGGLIHDPLGAVLEQLRATDQLPTDGWVYEHAILPAIAKYQQIVDTRGLAAITDEQDLALKVAEQTTLLEGLVWMFVRTVLPVFHVEHRVLIVEREFVSVVGCTCGLGDRIGEAETHDHRGCDGIGWMTRADCVSQRRSAGAGGGGYRYDEFKTTADASANWEAQWYHRVQLVAGVLGAEEKLGGEIDEVYIHALLKGRRQATWDPMEGKASGPKYQSSPLVYGGRRAANLPLYDEQWTPKWAGQYELDEASGKNRKVGKEFARTGVWELPASLWEAGGCLSPVDYWTRWIATSGVLEQQYKLVGPIYRKGWKLDAFLTQLQGEEHRWRSALDVLYKAAEEDGIVNWADPRFQALLDYVVPQTRGGACESFFGDKCPYLKLCDRYDGWEDPGGMDFVARRPHHAPELEQAIGRGLLAPDEGLADEGEE